ncbi:MAG: alpha/beta fold hydrolase [Chitinophagaceae bacterium]|nr:alpha/beta fold hydrolase [Chitinophagaceae bacterium]
MQSQDRHPMNFAQKLVISYFSTKFKLWSKLSKRKAAEKAFDLFCTPVPGGPKKTPAVFTKAEKLHLKMEDVKLVGYRWNHPQPKKVLILHGFSSTIKKFDHFVTPLVNKGYEVLAFDAPAHGESGGKRINVLSYMKMIETVYEKFGPIHSFTAHSFGGIALSLFMEQQIYQEHKKMVLIAPVTETTTALDNYCKLLKIDDAVKNELRNIIYEKRNEWPEWYSIRRAAHNIKAEVLWIHDEEDEQTPWSDAEKVMQDAHPNFRFMVTKGLGHRKIYRDNQVKKAVFEFL